MSLVECVPNFSEGRRTEVIEAIVDAIVSIPVHLLDVSSDPDHNRTVVTFAGEPANVSEAAFQGIEMAARLINLDEHRGVHPRIGAADVVPFVPLRAVTMDVCIEMARQLGQRVANELQLPVYLYEAAALRPERANLAVVRNPGYEALKTSIQTDVARAPDFGPARLGNAGAVTIGARGPLVAFNVYLDTDDVEVARHIAMTIRTSGGGLPYLKALGLLVKGQAQVSMNIVDYRKTSLHEILETVRSETTKRGTHITHTELVGLVPQRALIDAALAYLQLPESAKELLLEKCLGIKTGDYREVIFE